MGNKHTTSLPPQVVEELEESTAFSYAEINDLYRQFRHDCPDLHMTVTQFKRLYRETFPNGNPDHFAEHIFKTFDTKNRGYIDFRQFLTTLSSQLKGSFEDKLKWLFGVYDTDATGFITKEDFANMIEALHDLNAAAFPAQEHHGIDEIVDHVMKQADQNHDGKINLQDFMNASLTSNTLASLLQSTIKAADSPYMRRKERRGSIGIPLHHHQQHLHVVGSETDVDQKEEVHQGPESAPKVQVGRRASLTPNMLDFNSLMKH